MQIDADEIAHSRLHRICLWIRCAHFDIRIDEADMLGGAGLGAGTSTYAHPEYASTFQQETWSKGMAARLSEEWRGGGGPVAGCRDWAGAGGVEASWHSSSSRFHNSSDHDLDGGAARSIDGMGGGPEGGEHGQRTRRTAQLPLLQFLLSASVQTENWGRIREGKE